MTDSKKVYTSRVRMRRGVPLKGTTPVKKTRRPISHSDRIFHLLMSDLELVASWIKELFPVRSQRLDFSKIRIVPNEFYSENLGKRVADMIYSIPYLDAPGNFTLTLILEHKGQSSSPRDRVTIAQTLTYLTELCLRDAINALKRPRGESDGSQDCDERATVITQPIAVIVYTGADAELEDIDWQESFPAPPGFEDLALTFPHVFINMTRKRLTGELPHSPFLEIMYNLMTRHDKSEFLGLEKTAFEPLAKFDGEWDEPNQRLVRALLNYYENQAESLGVEIRNESFTTLINTVTSEGRMRTSALSRYFAPIAKKEGYEEGIEDGIEKGIEKERTSSLNAQRVRVQGVVQDSFGFCPAQLKNAIGQIQDLDELFDLRLFTLTRAETIEDVLEFAKKRVLT